jgi:hypothetical protein
MHRVQNVLNTVGHKTAGNVMQRSQILCASWDALLTAVKRSQEGSAEVVCIVGDVKGPHTFSGEGVKNEWFQQQSRKSHAAVKHWLVRQRDSYLKGHDDYF